MKLMEDYNKDRTKKILEEIKKGFTKEISFDDIYSALGAEKFNYEQVTGDMPLNDYFPALNPQNMSSSYGSYVSSVNNAYDKNLTYYHLSFSEKKSSERMIINIQKQENTIKLAQKMLSIIMDKGMENSRINSFKFMVGKKMPDKIKNDKIVIYYDKINRDIVSKIVFEAAQKANIEFVFNHLSAFYHLASVSNSDNKEEQEKYSVGVGVEIGGTSFTAERAKEIFKFMTGQSAPQNINAAEGVYLYDDLESLIGEPTNAFPIRDEIKEMEPEKFVEDAYNLCIKYCKPFL